jgi:uncharacterized membrane protein YczE
LEETRPKKRFVLPAELSLLIGSVLLTFSVILARTSNFGVAVLTSVPFVISQKFTFISAGAWNTVIMTLLLIILIVLTKKNIKAAAMSLALSFVFGWLIDLAIWLLSGLPTDIGWRIAYYIISFFAIPMGITLFVKSGYPMLPFDSFVRDMSSYYGWKFSLTKTIFDIIFVTFSVLFSLFALGGLRDVGVGTIISAVFTGFVIKLYSQALDKVMVVEPWFPKFRDFFSNPGQETAEIK